MNAQQALQRRIDVQQDADAIVYALRSIKACGGWQYCTGVHAGQLAGGAAAAGRVLGEAVVVGCVGDFAGPADRYYSARPNGRTKQQLTRALKVARDELKAAKAACGGVRQLRLALADAHELPLAA